ncbi:MAG: lipopolysaccharide biosynthesis protein [Hyphomicrobiales bacterium]
MSVARKTRNKQMRSGVFWSALNLLVTKGLSVVVRLVLARLLVPEQFGLVALVIVALGLAMVIVDLGIKRALIQRPRDPLTLVRFDSAFWFHFVFGAVVTVFFVAAVAPLLVTLYDEPLLFELSLVMSGSILFNCISIVPLVRLTRRLRFRPIVIAEILAVLLSSVVAIVLASLGAGVWSLALQQLVLFSFRAIALFAMSRWHPRLRFSVVALMDILSFSAYSFGSKIIQYLRTRSDTLIVGYILGTTSLGLYTMAYLVTEVLRSSISTVVNKIMLPVLSRVQGDSHETARIFSSATRYMTLLIFPISLSFFLHADWLVELVFEAEWYDMKAPIKILALSGIVFAMGGPAAELFQASGRPDLLFRLLITNFFFVALPLTVYMTNEFGLVGTAYAVVISMVILRLRMQWSIYKFFPTVFSKLIRVLLRALATLAVCLGIHVIAADTLPVPAKIVLYFVLFYAQTLRGAKQLLRTRKPINPN